MSEDLSVFYQTERTLELTILLKWDNNMSEASQNHSQDRRNYNKHIIWDNTLEYIWMATFSKESLIKVTLLLLLLF